MELSFRTKLLLAIISAAFGVLSLVNPWFGVLGAGVIGLSILIDYLSYKTEKAEFVDRLVHELWILGGRLITTGTGDNRQIPYNKWSGKGTSFQKSALGNDYTLWKSFYDSMDSRNDFFAAHAGYQPFHYEDSRKLKLSCLVKFIELSGTTMIQQSDHKKQFEEIVVKARRQRDTMSASENPDSLSV